MADAQDWEARSTLILPVVLTCIEQINSLSWRETRGHFKGMMTRPHCLEMEVKSGLAAAILQRRSCYSAESYNDSSASNESHLHGLNFPHNMIVKVVTRCTASTLIPEAPPLLGNVARSRLC